MSPGMLQRDISGRFVIIITLDPIFLVVVTPQVNTNCKPAVDVVAASGWLISVDKLFFIQTFY